MTIEAQLKNSEDQHEVVVRTNTATKSLAIPGKPEGRGSGINGGELLLTAIATCFCNDLYREAARRKIDIRSIRVAVSGDFGGEGEPAKSISYSATIDSPSPQHELDKLIHDVDRIAEIHNTLRQGIDVKLSR